MSNRLTKTTDGVVTTYTYNALNQLISENDITYSYDTNGNQVAQDGAAKSADYSYDPEGRLVRAVVTTAGTTITETYQYNWNGIRIAKITDGVETKYLIDPNSSLSQVLAELDSAGNLVTYYTRGAGLISLHRTGETRYYLYDPNSSVRILTNETGIVTDTYTYDAFGNLLAKTGMTANNYLYTGEQFDANTGFYYLRARYMNPSTGTFISMDPYAGSIFDPISLHKYLYANANPIMNRDPSGRETKESLVVGMGIHATIAEALLAFDATAITIFNSISASLVYTLLALSPLAMFVANNPAFIDLCMRVANGDISTNALREFLQDLFHKMDDAISNFIDKITNRNNSNSNNSSNSGTNSNAQPPQDPIDPNKLKHLFDNLQHGFDKFLNSYGGDKEAAYRDMQKAAQNYIDQNNITGEFKDIIVNVNGFDITVRGYVIDGVAKIGTAFIS